MDRLPHWKTNSKTWWFGILNADHGHVHRLSNLKDDKMTYMIFREVVSTKNNKPFIEGLIIFSEKLAYGDVKHIIGASYVKSSSHIEHAIRNFKTGDFFEVEVQCDKSFGIRELIKASIRGGLEVLGTGLGALSNASKNAASYIE